MARRRTRYNAANIRAMREAAEKTQQEMANELGVSMSTISLWERGIRAPSGLTEILVDRFVKRYGLDVEPFERSA